VPLGAGCAIFSPRCWFVTAANWNRFASLIGGGQGSDKEFFVALVPSWASGHVHRGDFGSGDLTCRRARAAIAEGVRHPLIGYFTSPMAHLGLGRPQHDG
jgi:hypothetical protein